MIFIYNTSHNFTCVYECPRDDSRLFSEYTRDVHNFMVFLVNILGASVSVGYTIYCLRNHTIKEKITNALHAVLDEAGNPVSVTAVTYSVVKKKVFDPLIHQTNAVSYKLSKTILEYLKGRHLPHYVERSSDILYQDAMNDAEKIEALKKLYEEHVSPPHPSQDSSSETASKPSTMPNKFKKLMKSVKEGLSFSRKVVAAREEEVPGASDDHNSPLDEHHVTFTGDIKLPFGDNE